MLSVSEKQQEGWQFRQGKDRGLGQHRGEECLTGGIVMNCSATWTLSMGKFCCAASSWDVLGLLGPFE